MNIYSGHVQNYQFYVQVIIMPGFDAKAPFNELPTLPPRADIETRAILKACIKARSAIAELKQVGKIIPNQDVLVNTIPLREAKDSSAIENIITTEDKLFRLAATDEPTADQSTKETLRYRTAMFEGYHGIDARPLTTAAAVRVCQTIRGVGVDVDVRNTPGTALRSTLSDEIIYTPPEGERLLRQLLGDWEKFLHNETDVDPLIRMAVGHYQFEAIHPFTDGNGRTGRILNILFLISEGLLEIPVLYLSRYIIENKEDYYRLLQEVTTEQQWEAWILFMLSAVETTANWTIEKIIIIRELLDHTCEYVSVVRPSLYSKDLVELTFTQPYLRIADVTGLGIAKRATASKYLQELKAMGVLHDMKIGRDKLFIHVKFLRLLMDEGNTFEPYVEAAKS
jgi:Fic family protein